MAQSLRDVGVDSPVGLLATYAGKKVDFDPWLAGAQLNHDGDLRLQYLAGWGLDSNLEDVIYRQMMNFRRRPDGLFTGSAERVQALFAAMEVAGLHPPRNFDEHVDRR